MLDLQAIFKANTMTFKTIEVEEDEIRSNVENKGI